MDQSGASGAALSVGDGLPIVALCLSGSERVCKLVDDSLWALRPADPSGRWSFSLGELVMHIADARWLFAGQLDGADYSPRYFVTNQPRDPGAIWTFRPGAPEAALESLQDGRAAIQRWLEQPLEKLWQPTSGTEDFFHSYQQKLRAAGEEEMAQAYARRGPASLARTLSGLVAHESGHRGSLQTLLRLQGANTAEAD
ncbi:hypothetical protein IT575_12770 [bacterium]|nr:hypothetical protein [bacterium]